jgi:hypothetical protein
MQISSINQNIAKLPKMKRTPPFLHLTSQKTVSTALPKAKTKLPSTDVILKK